MRPPALTHPSAAVFLGDCLDVLAEMPDNSVDAIVTDPPYGLGFMGKAWDDLPPGLPWARECLRVLKPGGHLLAFGGTRTWHRLAVAVEDAGFEMRDSIAWLYGSGFPKSLDVSKAIDKMRTEDRAPSLAVTRYLEASRLAAGLSREDVNNALCGGRHRGQPAQGYLVTLENGQIPPTVPHLRHWEILKGLLRLDDSMDSKVRRLNGRKGTYGDAWNSREVIERRNDGAGNGSVVGLGSGQSMATEYDITAPATPAAQQWAGWGTALKPAFEPIVVARKPLVGTVAANVLAHGTGALNIDATRVGAPEDKRAAGTRRYISHGKEPGADGGEVQPAPHDGKGRWPTNVVLDDHAAAELDATGPRTKDGVAVQRNRSGEKPASVYGTFQTTTDDQGYGGEGGPSRFFPVFKYQAKAPTRERPTVVAEDGTKTAHPTVKPLALMRWLVRLVTPAGGTVLDTFAGSGATIEAAVEEGFYALGIEREESYLPLIGVRLDRVEAPGEDAEGAA